MIKMCILIKQSALSNHIYHTFVFEWFIWFKINQTSWNLVILKTYFFPKNYFFFFCIVFGVIFNKATQLSKKKNNTADALFICDSSHIIEHVQNGLKMSIHSTTTGRPTNTELRSMKGLEGRRRSDI